MKQKLVLLFVVLVLATIPASADRMDVPNLDTFTDPSGGAPIATLTDDGTDGSWRMQITSQVFLNDTTGVYTYVYEIFHNSSMVIPGVPVTFPLVLTSIFSEYFNPTLDEGSVGGPFLEADTEFNANNIVFHFDAAANWDGAADFFDPALIVYAQSTSGPINGTIAVGNNLFTDIFINAIGPGDTGGGSATDPVPEPGSLILLTSGLLSGGYLKFKRRKKELETKEKDQGVI